MARAICQNEVQLGQPMIDLQGTRFGNPSMHRNLTIAAALLIGLAGSSMPVQAASKTPATLSSPMPKLTIYHLEGRRSARVVWLMEELGLPYTLEFKPGDLAGSMAAIRAINPTMPVAPTVVYGDQVLVESGAILEMVLARHGEGKLVPNINSPDYATHLMWMHYAEGSLAARLFSDYRAWMGNPPKARSRLVDSEAVVQYAEDFLGKNPYFGGSEFSAADIMMMFPLNVAVNLNIVEKKQFPNVNAWLAKMEARPGYKRMIAKALPNGMVGNLPVLPAHAPSGPRTPPTPG
jgi:glutathione S-transferase